MLDLSSKMLSLARSKVPAELARNVEIVNQDFMQDVLCATIFRSNSLHRVAGPCRLARRSHREDGCVAEAKW